MQQTLIEKLVASHLVEGVIAPGEGVSIRVDQTLTQDTTGTMAFLQFEAMGVPRVKTELSVSYLDHKTIQGGFEDMDDHLYLQTTAAKYGVLYSRPGNGICHQVHLERFGKPGKTLIGSDSHTPTAGGIGMLAFGAGGMDVALAMAGEPFSFKMPEVVKVVLTGKLRPWVSAKDVILEMLRRYTVKGGVNKAFEFAGPGVASLTIPERSTITNMATELGATTSIFPSDEVTKAFLTAQQRAEDFTELHADEDAVYADTIEIDLSTLGVLVAKPHMPDKVVNIEELSDIHPRQVAICSCTNSSYTDLVEVAQIMKGHHVHPDVEMSIAPGSRQVLEMLARDGHLADLISSGVRILECGCGPCGGGGQAPNSRGISMRSNNRNFIGRSGTLDAQIYLASASTCAATAIAGHFTDAREYADKINAPMPDEYIADDSMVIFPPEDGSEVEVLRGPNIKPIPDFEPLDDHIDTTVTIKVKNNISTDHIMPNSLEAVKLRSNLPAISKFVFGRTDKEFAQRTIDRGNGIIVAGENYGQGSSREHAAMGPRYLNIKAVIAKSFARIHMQNLANFGVLPLVFDDPEDYNSIDRDDELEICNVVESARNNDFTVNNLTKGTSFKAKHQLTPHQVEVLIDGGLLQFIKKQHSTEE